MRITAEHNVVPKFSIASECGWTRTNSNRVPGPASSHRFAAQNLSKTNFLDHITLTSFSDPRATLRNFVLLEPDLKATLVQI